MGYISRLRPSPAMVIAVIALFVAMGGVGYTAVRVDSGDVKNRSLRDIDAKKNTWTGKTIKESKLGEVPSANRATSAINATNATNATNASQLGGVSSSSYKVLNGTLRSGQTEQGVLAGGAGANALINLQIEFDPDLPADLDSAHTVLVSGSPSATHCPGLGQAEAGYFCLYEVSKGNSTFVNVGNPIEVGGGADRTGATIVYATTGTFAYVYGGWAVTAP
jgi:hypothetical protein